MGTVEKYLSVEYGYDDGSGDGYGYGSGSGYYGYGSGSGYYGYGDGSGYGVKSLNGQNINRIDGVPTILSGVKKSVAKGFILESDLTLLPCFVVKQNNLFAHGDTLREARQALQDKLFEDMPEDERINAFVTEFKPDVKYDVPTLSSWHGKLTGSCKVGRESFMRSRNINMSDKLTVEEFIRITSGAYGGDTIEKLKSHYKGE